MTQKQRISQYMDDFGSISTLEAFRDLGITRLAARIYELIDSGMPISKTPETKLNRYGEKVTYMRYKKAV